MMGLQKKKPLCSLYCKKKQQQHICTSVHTKAEELTSKKYLSKNIFQIQFSTYVLCSVGNQGMLTYTTQWWRKYSHAFL